MSGTLITDDFLAEKINMSKACNICNKPIVLTPSANEHGGTVAQTTDYDSDWGAVTIYQP